MERVNLTTVNGDSEKYAIKLVDGENAAVDITGATIKMTIRKKSGESVLTKTNTAHPNPTEGLGEIRILANDTQGFEATVYDYDIQILFASGDLKTLFIGDFSVTQGVTND